MALVEWNESFSVGVAFFDMQHKQLISMLNELYDAIESGKGKAALEPTLQRLTGYWLMHFTAEEQKMKEFDFPELAVHQMEHAAFNVRLKEFKEKLIAGNAELPAQVLDFINNWFVTHIAGTDMKYKDFFNSKGLH